MARHWFYSPVPVSCERAGMCYHVNNVERAAEELLKWTKRGPKWNYAVRICMACLADQMPTQEARKAFESAANEEGMFLTPS